MIETEEEFLRRYDPSIYRHPSVAVDCLVKKWDSVLLVRRGGHPYMGRLALPGGFIEYGESAEQAVERELMEETGIKVARISQFGFASTPGRDPRDWNISLIFTAEYTSGEPTGGDDASDAQFYGVSLEGNELKVGEHLIVLDIKLNESGELDYNKTKELKNGVLAFDHAKIIAAALLKQRNMQKTQ